MENVIYFTASIWKVFGNRVTVWIDGEGGGASLYIWYGEGGREGETASQPETRNNPEHLIKKQEGRDDGAVFFQTVAI